MPERVLGLAPLKSPATTGRATEPGIVIVKAPLLTQEAGYLGDQGPGLSKSGLIVIILGANIISGWWLGRIP